LPFERVRGEEEERKEKKAFSFLLLRGTPG
jgi:hypothetical protein